MAQAANDLKSIVGDNFVNKKGEKVSFADGVNGMDIVLVYFSAHWCPPCRGFTPVLKESYEAMKKAGNKVELIFVSSDQSDEKFKEYFNEMADWLAVPFGAEEGAAMKKTFNVQGIPFLVALDATGKTVDAQ
eukprot:CAMPEP_0197023614 /NCGR_PEP_ID=MMETSP1384-20130603/4285_1 /TAXON_ID=29189 /ORGANISM="Ammonia sp." /LENGTH=131 /DNA_ID=CAMNT_0042451855 /DNA_START=117 /DNA_END=509 /DNA_ORIENTATION=+